MVWLFSGLALLSVAVILVCIAESDYSKDWPVMVGILAGFMVIVFVMLAIVPTASSGYDKRDCDRFGRNTGYQVKFVKYSYWSWDCFAKTKSGRWVYKDQILGTAKS